MRFKVLPKRSTGSSFTRVSSGTDRKSHISPAERRTDNAGTVAFYRAFASSSIGETYGSHKDRTAQGDHEARRRTSGACPSAGPAPTGGATNKRREATDCPRSPTDSQRSIRQSSSASKRARCVAVLFEIIVSNRARKSLKQMPKYYARRVILALEVLTRNPAPALQYDVKKLKGVKDTYRIRIADI